LSVEGKQWAAAFGKTERRVSSGAARERAVADELFDLVDENGRVIGRAPRAACHADPRLLHRAVHVFVLNAHDEIFLQRRSRTKDIQPGKWDTSVGGHVALGESFEQAAQREMAEELGLRDLQPQLLHQYIWRSPVESELVRTYRCTHGGPFSLQAEEIEEGRFFAPDELRRMAGRGLMTPNLEHELRLLGILPPPGV
jgi:isopentenyl-diphosphate delta-isomerase type 1